jgi:hypothetical protein
MSVDISGQVVTGDGPGQARVRALRRRRERGSSISVRALAVVLPVVGLLAPFITPQLQVAAATARTEEAQGGWIEALPCPYTALAPAAGLPTTVSWTCPAGTLWDGTWTGHTHFIAKGATDLVSGDGTGTLDETFVGTAPADHSKGSLHLLGDWVMDGASSTIRIHETIVDATGQFAGAKGQVTFEGLLGGNLGHGGYHGWWSRPTTGS